MTDEKRRGVTVRSGCLVSCKTCVNMASGVRGEDMLWHGLGYRQVMESIVL